MRKLLFLSPLLAGFLTIAVVAVGLIWLFDPFAPYLVRALPRTASDVQHHSLDVFPDHASFMKARVDAKGFRQFVENLKLSPHDSANEEENLWVSWELNPDVPWWNPSAECRDTFVRNDGDIWTYAKYEGGYIFAQYFSH